MNVLSKSISSVRPSDYDDVGENEVTTKPGSLSDTHAITDALPLYNDLPTCQLSDMPSYIDNIITT